MADKYSNNSNAPGSNMYLSINSRATSAYNRVAVDARIEVATPHELISMLYDGVLESLANAQGALRRNDLATKGKALNKCILLLGEGLKGGLSPAGGDLTENLNQLYDYCILRLSGANINNDEAAIEEVRSLIVTVSDGWRGISKAQRGEQNV